MSDDIKYPATQVVHCPSGPTNACDIHAREIIGLFAFMGARIVSSKIDEPAECGNCVNEAKAGVEKLEREIDNGEFQ